MASTAMLREVLGELNYAAYHALRAEAGRHLAVCEGCGSAEGTRQVRDLFSYARLRWLCAPCYGVYGKAFEALRAEECFPE